MSRKPKNLPVTPPSQPSHSTPSSRLARDPSGVAYIFPDGRGPVEDADAMFTALAAKESHPGELKRLLWGLADRARRTGEVRRRRRIPREGSDARSDPGRQGALLPGDRG